MSTRNNTKEVTKVTDINKEFIEEYIRSTNNIEDLVWIKDTKWNCTVNEERKIRKSNPMLSDEQISAKARRQYFGAFRAEFAKKFYPELIVEKSSKKEREDSLALAIAARIAILNAAY